MRIIEIKAQDNGAHRNQTGDFKNIPEGWAVIPDDMETPNFPFGEIETTDEDIKATETVIKTETADGKEVETIEKVEKVIGTRKVVTKWTAGTIPDAEEEKPLSKVDQLIETLYKAGKLTEEEYKAIAGNAEEGHSE